jgi:uncharacterized protein YdeI (YjbR/CyaY-like superfamily)
VAWQEKAWGHFGRITALSDLPPEKVLIGYVKKAAQLNEAGVKKPMSAKPKATKEVVVPDDLTAALKRSKKALATFEGFSPSHKREYVEWITEAKREETRRRWLVTAVEWLAKGRPRNWKYVNC